MSETDTEEILADTRGVDETDPENIRRFLEAAGAVRVQPPAPGVSMFWAYVDGEIRKARSGRSGSKESSFEHLMGAIERNGNAKWYYRDHSPFAGTDK